MQAGSSNALVLSGGGARGAYEVGVMLYVREVLPKRLGRHLHFDVITGTSVGALNGSFLAATATDEHNQAKRLAKAWRELHLEKLIALSPTDIFKAGRLLLGKSPPPPEPGTYRYGGILNTAGLEEFVFRFVPWRGIRRSIRAGALRGLAVTATHVGTGHTVVFLDTAKPVHTWSQNPFIRAVPAAISPRHALASAAIPMLFPAVKVGRAFYVDGGLRNNTPMSPAIRLGADRLLVVSLQHKATQVEENAKAVMHESDYPKPLFLLGKALNSLMLDPTEYDLERLEKTNAILRAGEEAYGSEFAKVISTRDRKESPLRQLKAVHIQPSVDIGGIAADLLARGGPKLSSRVARNLLHRMAKNESAGEADMLSYLLFDGEFASELLELGFQDAKTKEDELVSVFGSS
ncbi:MAG: patatin-like phospholipase family protein [Myxococcales bacterium]|nr:patatin-like phospholipase family protein [Myxococcales bacterium]